MSENGVKLARGRRVKAAYRDYAILADLARGRRAGACCASPGRLSLALALALAHPAREPAELTSMS